MAVRIQTSDDIDAATTATVPTTSSAILLTPDENPDTYPSQAESVMSPYSAVKS